MNEFLAELYDTPSKLGGATQEDLAKQAAVDLVTKVAEASGINPDELTDEQIEHVMTNSTHYAAEMDKIAAAPAAPAAPGDQLSDEDVEKLAEADIVGRAMAHAYVDELHEIEKQAGKIGEGLKAGKELAGRVGGRIGEWTGVSGMRAAHKGMKASKGRASELERGMGTLAGKGDKGSGSYKSLQARLGKAKGDTETYKGLRSEYGKQFAKRVGAPAAGVAALGGVAAALNKKSADAQFEEYALARANEVLEKTAEVPTDEEYAQLVEKRASEILEENGYQVSWE